MAELQHKEWVVLENGHQTFRPIRTPNPNVEADVLDRFNSVKDSTADLSNASKDFDTDLRITDKDVPLVLEQIEKHPDVTNVNLYMNLITDAGAEQLIAGLESIEAKRQESGGKAFAHVNLAQNALGDAGFKRMVGFNNERLPEGEFARREAARKAIQAQQGPENTKQ